MSSPKVTSASAEIARPMPLGMSTPVTPNALRNRAVFCKSAVTRPPNCGAVETCPSKATSPPGALTSAASADTLPSMKSPTRCNCPDSCTTCPARAADASNVAAPS